MVVWNDVLYRNVTASIKYNSVVGSVCRVTVVTLQNKPEKDSVSSYILSQYMIYLLLRWQSKLYGWVYESGQDRCSVRQIHVWEL